MLTTGRAVLKAILKNDLGGVGGGCKTILERPTVGGRCLGGLVAGILVVVVVVVLAISLSSPSYLNSLLCDQLVLISVVLLS